MSKCNAKNAVYARANRLSLKLRTRTRTRPPVYLRDLRAEARERVLKLLATAIEPQPSTVCPLPRLRPQ